MNDYRQYDDRQLMELLVIGNEQAFTALYERYWKKLFVIAYNRLQEIQSAEDIVHDVFASLWASRQKLQVEKPENYLAVATKYMVLARIKKIKRERLYIAGEETPVTDFTAENSLHYKRILELVHKEVENLPEKCRLIFKYSRNDGMPVKEIAKELSISPKTVENQLNKALKQLKVAARSFFSFFC